MQNPSALPDLGPFEAIKGKYLAILDDVFAKYKLDALVYPQLTEMYPENFSDEEPVETTVSEVCCPFCTLLLAPDCMFSFARNGHQCVTISQDCTAAFTAGDE